MSSGLHRLSDEWRPPPGAASGNWIADGAKRLVADLGMRLELGILLGVMLPYAGELVGRPVAANYRDGLSFIVLAAATAILLALSGLRQGATDERRLHFGASLAFLCWAAAEVVESIFWDGDAGLLAVVVDALYLAFFAGLLLATDDPHRATAARAPGLRRLERLSFAVCMCGLLLYFVAVPARTDPAGYLSAVPSTILYLWLDAVLLLWFLWRGRDASRPRERMRWLLLRFAAVSMMTADALDLLIYADRLSAFPPAADLLWFLPFVAVVAAARVGPVERAARGSSAASEIARAEIAFADLGWSLTALMPLSHLVTEAVGGLAASTANPRRAVVVASTITLFALAVLQQRRVSSVQQRMLEEVEYLRARAAAGSRLEAIGSLAAGVARDFDQLVEALRERCAAIAQLELDAASRRDRDAMERAAERAAALTHELLAVGQSEPPSRRAIDLRAWIGEAVTALRELAGEQVDLAVDPGTEALWCEADTAQLERVAANLVTNARDAMRGGGRLEVILSRRVDKMGSGGREQAVMSFRDAGSGMDAATRERIFEPFFTTKTERVGHGLGLATALGLVRAHGGDIRVKSVPGAGSTFEVVLPLGGTPVPPVASR